jgi:hypothetical protein
MAGKSTQFLHPHKGPVPKRAEIVSHTSHGNAAQPGHHVPGNLPRDGKGKSVHPVLVHGGMSRRQLSMNAMGHANATAPDANPASPLSKQPQGKHLQPIPVTPGMRSRTHAAHSGMDRNALGEAILQEAFDNSSADDCMAHGRVKT